MKPTVFPEVLRDGRGYTIQSGPGASTDKLTRTITIPYGGDPSEQFVRLHELGHVKWTPTTDPGTVCNKYGVTMDSLQAAEDCRIHIGLISRGALRSDSSTALGHKTPYNAYLLHRMIQYWSNPVNPYHDRLRNAVQCLVSISPMERDYALLRDVIEEIFKEHKHELSPFFDGLRDSLAEKFFTRVAPKYIPRDRKVEVTRTCHYESFSNHQWAVDRLMGDADRRGIRDILPDEAYSEVEIPPFEKSIEVAAWIDHMLPPDGKPKPLPGLFKEDLSKKPPTAPGPLKKEHIQFGDREDGWGVLYYEVAPMNPLAHIVRMLNTKVPSDMGTRMRSLERIISDSKVFERRKKLQGGTILVDCSGSMGWSMEDIMTLLKAAPAATVALYAGTTCSIATNLGTKLPANSGVIRIVVHRGHIADEHDCHFAFGANVVDGPALEWLATQAEPRIWVSDGQVTGCGEQQHARLGLEVTMTCNRARIVRLGDLEDTLAAFQAIRFKRKIHGRTPYNGEA